MHTNRRDLLLAGACAASTALFWSVVARLRAEEVQSAARDHYNPPCEEPEHLHRSTVRGERPLECRGVCKRRLR